MNAKYPSAYSSEWSKVLATPIAVRRRIQELSTDDAAVPMEQKHVGMLMGDFNRAVKAAMVEPGLMKDGTPVNGNTVRLYRTLVLGWLCGSDDAPLDFLSSKRLTNAQVRALELWARKRVDSFFPEVRWILARALVDYNFSVCCAADGTPVTLGEVLSMQHEQSQAVLYNPPARPSPHVERITDVIESHEVPEPDYGVYEPEPETPPNGGEKAKTESGYADTPPQPGIPGLGRGSYE